MLEVNYYHRIISKILDYVKVYPVIKLSIRGRIL